MVENIFVRYVDVDPAAPVAGRGYRIIAGPQYVLVLVEKKREFNCNSPDLEFRWDEPCLRCETKMDIKDFNNPRKFEAVKEKISVSLQALRYADRFLFKANKELDSSQIMIKFTFDSIKISKSYSFGKISNYKVKYS
ncbi:MAG: hypothetical protein LBV08_00750 [Clostridiales bacterium]|nr:hypothetical protein [Clostridiales bacterium]